MSLTLLDTCILAVSAAFLWVVIFVSRPALQRDTFRERLFRLRDELFDYAASGAIPFTHPAYHILRSRIHGLIREPERATMTSGLLYKFCTGRDLEPVAQVTKRAFEDAVNTLPHETVQARLMNIQHDLHDLVADHVWHHSLVMMTGVGLYTLLLRWWTAQPRPLRVFFRPILDEIDAAAELASA